MFIVYIICVISYILFASISLAQCYVCEDFFPYCVYTFRSEFSMAGYYSILWTDHNLFFLCIFAGYLGSFQFETTINNASIYIQGHVFLWTYAWLSIGYTLGWNCSVIWDTLIGFNSTRHFWRVSHSREKTLVFCCAYKKWLSSSPPLRVTLTHIHICVIPLPKAYLLFLGLIKSQV